NIVDRTEASDIAGEVQYATIILAVCLAGTAADLLHVEAGRTCRAQHGDEIDVRDVKAIREDHHADQTSQPPGAKILDDPIALVVRGLAQDHFTIDATRAQRIAHQLSMLNADAVD